MRKYILAFLITIPILLLVWNISDSSEEPINTHNVSLEEGASNQVGILQETDGIVSEQIGGSRADSQSGVDDYGIESTAEMTIEVINAVLLTQNIKEHLQNNDLSGFTFQESEKALCYYMGTAHNYPNMYVFAVCKVALNGDIVDEKDIYIAKETGHLYAKDNGTVVELNADMPKGIQLPDITRNSAWNREPELVYSEDGTSFHYAYGEDGEKVLDQMFDFAKREEVPGDWGVIYYGECTYFYRRYHEVHLVEEHDTHVLTLKRYYIDAQNGNVYEEPYERFIGGYSEIMLHFVGNIEIGEEYGQSKEQAEPIYIIQLQLTLDDTYEMQDWQEAYIEYIEEFERKESCYYSLIYMDEDDIPELVIDTEYGAGGCTILTFYNGKVDALQTDGLLFYYIEKKNLLNNTGGRMGYYFDRIYSIENGKWVYVTGGENRENHENQTEYYVEYLYEWEGKPVDEDEYKEKIADIFDREQEKEPEQYERLDEMLFRLQMGTARSQTHRYELYVEDITWDEAKRRCEEKGGYLATITTTEEYECIKNGIEDSGQTQVAYWMGASYDRPSIYGPIYEWHEPNRDYLKDIFISDTFMGKYWADGEPSYYRQAAEEKIDKTGIYLLYDDAKEGCYLYDVPMDMLARNPEYTGRIGYICEYDSVTVMAKENWFYPSDGSLACWYEYEYDSGGRKTKTMSSNDPEWEWAFEWEYDNMGNLTKYMEYRSGEIYIWREYEYITMTPHNEATETKADIGGFR